MSASFWLISLRRLEPYESIEETAKVAGFAGDSYPQKEEF